jgi:hypothetical protein
MGENSSAACEGKHPFDTYLLAKQSLRYNEKNRGVYHCTVCGKFHVGTRFGRKKRRPAVVLDLEEV